MRTLTVLATLTLGTTLLGTPVRADDPSPVKYAPEVRALLNDLLKTANGGANDEAKPADPTPAPAQPAAPNTGQKIPPELIPQVQALLKELTKAVNAEANDEATPTVPSTAPVPATTPSSAQKTQSPLLTPGLTTGRLSTSHLMPSGALGGNGLNGGTPRLSDTDWRQLFPVKSSK